MTNQKLVLEQITALNTTTANIIDGTPNMLKDNTARIHEQAASSTITMETLSRAFQNIYDTMEAIDSRSEEHTSELQSLMRNSYAVLCLKKNTNTQTTYIIRDQQ